MCWNSAGMAGAGAGCWPSMSAACRNEEAKTAAFVAAKWAEARQQLEQLRHERTGSSSSGSGTNEAAQLAADVLSGGASGSSGSCEAGAAAAAGGATGAAMCHGV
jgi:hypothetical protein